MATIEYSDGTKIEFSGSPTQQDAEEAYNQVKGIKTQAPISSTVEAPQENTYNASFPAKTGDNPLVAGAKALGNVPSSALNLVKGLGTAVLNPVDTVKSLGKVAVGGVQKLIPGEQEQEGDFNAFTNILKERYGSLENLQKTATNDPFGFGTDIVTAFTGGAGLVGKGSQATNLLSKTAQVVTKPVSRVAGAVTDKVSKTAKFATSQATGLNPETITELVKNPQAFKAANVPSRVEISEGVKGALDSRLDDLSDLGKEYQVLRDSNQVVTIPKDTISKVLDKYGVKLDKNGKIATTPESRPLSVGDKNALQEFIDNYGSQEVLSSNAFLNTREALSNLAKYDSSKTNISTSISRELRSAYDDIGKTQVKGLKELDTQFAPERKLLGQLKKDIFTPQGELKDGAISKIANITGKGKENLLTRMREIVPDIDQRVKVLKAVEDIERSSGIKVGTYARAGAGIFGASTGNIPMIIGAILAQPEIAVPLLKAYGYAGQKAIPILNALKDIANDVNNFKLPAPILDYVKDPKLGASIKSITPESVAKRIDSEDFNLIKDYLNKRDIESFTKAQPMIESMGLKGMEESNLNRFLKEVLDLRSNKKPS